MTDSSPVAAAFEGLRVMRREPRAVLAWVLLWFFVFLTAAVVVAAGKRVANIGHGASGGLAELANHFGPFAAAFIVLLLVVWATTTVATFRAVLRPAERRFFFMRLGADELRVAIMSIAAFATVLVFGGLPAYLLYVIASPFMHAVPTFARPIATVGALATVCLDIWLAVRLSLIAVETFAERRFHLAAYWPLTRGRFWYLFVAYFLYFLMFFVLTLIYVVLGNFLVHAAVVDIGAADLLRRTSVLAVAGLLAMLTSVSWVRRAATWRRCSCNQSSALKGRPSSAISGASMQKTV